MTKVINEKDFQIKLLPLESIKPYSKNPRNHSEQSIQAIKASIEAYGFANIVAVDKDMVIVYGHGRLEAAKQLGMASIPVLLTNLDKNEAKALRIADNQTQTLSGWNDELLQAEMLELHEAGMNLEPLGFEPQELIRIMDGEEQINDPGPCETPKTTHIKRGDIWLLGDHRLMCGDATNAQDVARLLGGAKPLLCVTDPPYGVEYDANWRNEAANKGIFQHAERRIGKVNNDDRIDWSDSYKLFPGNILYVWHAVRHAKDVQISIEQSGYEIRNQIIWAKHNFVISRGNYHWKHEPCYYAVRKGNDGAWGGKRDQTTLWEISLDKNVEGGHSTQKPLECMARPIRNHNTKEVYEPFSGSGTTIIAAEQLKRKCYAMEIEPLYVDVAIQRWQTATSKKATLEK